ncbi:MAG: hypothetical protein WC718_13110 [Phycisphaerales bacterium]|jgi:hypothetical protein
MADALGRTVRAVVVLDRDFHDEESVKAVYKEWATDAEKMGWSLLGVRMWNRNEIENYFLEDDVLLPVMTGAFKCTAQDVTNAVDSALRLLVPFQALQAAFQKTRDQWAETDPTTLLQAVDKALPSYKPAWTAAGLSGITTAQLEQDLPARLVKWRSLVCDKSGVREPWKGDAFLSAYSESVRKWSAYTSASPEWRNVLAGKEVLKLVRQQLCAVKGGWWSEDKSNPQPVAWSAMKNNRLRDKHDREVENTLRPDFVGRLVELVVANPTDARWEEFAELTAILAG